MPRPHYRERHSTAPRLHAGFLDRPRLSTHVGNLQQYRLVVVHAPAGSGKTSLLGQWAQTLADVGGLAAWYSATDNARDHLQLADCLLLSVHRASGLSRQDALNLRDDQNADARLIAALAAHRALYEGRHLTLFVDDFHLIEGDAEIRTLTQILAATGETLTLVVAGRNRPALPLGRYRLRGELLELSTRELQFSALEVQSFFRNIVGRDISADEAGQLQRSTEGWAAGLRLTSLIENAPNSNFLRCAPAGSQREYAEYFLDEVIAGLPEALCRFLEQTSVLEALAPDLCDAVTGTSGSAATLDGIERAQLFVTELAGAHRWYKYHQLFQEFLQVRLQTREPALVPRLHARASEWFIQANMPYDAVRHAFLANHPERAAALIERYCTFDYLSYGRFDTYSSWMAQLPRDSREQRPLLMFLMIWRYINLRHFLKAEQMLQVLAQAHAQEGVLREIAESSGMDIPGRIALMRALIGAYCGDMCAARDHIDSIGESRLDDLPFGQVDLLSIHAYVALNEGDLDRAERLTWRAHAIYDGIGCHWGRVHSLCIAAMSYLAACRWEDAERLLGTAMGIAHQHFNPGSYMMALPSALLGLLARTQGNMVQAEALWLSALPSEETAVPGLWERKLIAVLGLIRLYDHQGRDSEATTLLRRFHRAAIEEEDLRMEFRLNIEWADRALRAGDPGAMQQPFGQVLRQETEARTRLGPGIWQIWEPFGILMARAAKAGLVAGDPEDFLGGVISHAKTQSRYASALACQLSLSRILGLPEAQMGALHGEIEAAGLTQRLTPAASHPAVASAPEAEPSDPMQIAGLTSREAEVLMLMRLGARNHEIGTRLGININTVKTHTKNIFSKLNVRNRTEAVMKIS